MSTEILRQSFFESLGSKRTGSGPQCSTISQAVVADTLDLDASFKPSDK